jgi:hypothetical protein
MTRDEIIAKLKELTLALRTEDVLIDVDPSATFSLLDLVSVQHIIKDATGLETQAEMRRSIEPRFAKRIADDVIEVF